MDDAWQGNIIMSVLAHNIVITFSLWPVLSYFLKKTIESIHLQCTEYMEILL